MRNPKSNFPFEGTADRFPAPGENPKTWGRVKTLIGFVLIFGGPIACALIQLLKHLSK